MANTVRIFDFDIDVNGARVVLAKNFITSGCLSDGAVDAAIRELKEDLDAVGLRMKQEIRDRKKQPFFNGNI